MNAKYNRYKIILIGLLCNSIITISEEQSLTDQPIVDNIISNDDVVDDMPTGSSIENKENPNHDNQDNIQHNEDNEDNQKNNEPNDESKPQSIESSQSLKSNKNKKVINKSKVSPLLSKGAKISLGAIGVGGFGLLIRPSRKSSTSHSSSTLRGTSSSLKTGQEPSASSKQNLKELNDFFNKLKEKGSNKYYITEDELQTINTHFRKLNINDKMKLILDCCDMNITVRNISFNIDLEFYLISLIEQTEIDESLQTHVSLCPEKLFGQMISRNLKLWDIILRNSQTQEKRELFFILIDYTTELRKTKIKEIKKIVNHMIDHERYYDLLILLLIFNVNLCWILNNHKNMYLSTYLLSDFSLKNKQKLLSQMTKLNNKELEERYYIMSSNIDLIRNSLES